MSQRVIDYYFSPISPWTYLGHGRLTKLADRFGATLRVKPCDFNRIFAASGGFPLAQRPAQRRSYRLIELARFRDALGIPLNVHPKHFPVPPDPIALRIIAAGDHALPFAGACLTAVWSEERDLSSETELDALAIAGGLDPDELRSIAARDDTRRAFDAYTDEAIAAEVFGAPTYIPRFGPATDERFWGQDRLDMLERALVDA